MSDDNLADAMAEIQKMKKGIAEVQRLGEAIAGENESLRAQLARQTEALKALRFKFELAGKVVLAAKIHDRAVRNRCLKDALARYALATPEPAKSKEDEDPACVCDHVKSAHPVPDQDCCSGCDTFTPLPDAPPTPPEKKPTIADLCHKCKNGENVWRGDNEWVHGANGPRERCAASDLRDDIYGPVRRGYNPKFPEDKP